MSTKQEMRITDAEISMIKMTFGDNDVLLKTLRKIFLPEVTADAPIGQNFDLWMSMKVEDLPAEDVIVNLKARNTLIQHIETCLLQLKLIAGQKDESVEQTKERLKKDSSK